VGLSRFNQWGYEPVLGKLYAGDLSGISFSQRRWISACNRKEPKLWKWNSVLYRSTLVFLILITLGLLLLGAFGGPRGWFSVFPIFIFPAFILLVSVSRQIVRAQLLKRRPLQSLDDFCNDCGLAELPKTIVTAARTAIANSYRVPPEIIYPWDNERSLRALSGTLPPYAFEVILGTAISLNLRLNDEDVDRIANRFHRAARTIKDVVSILVEEFKQQTNSSN
jgi:hypothetical protein